MQTFLKIKEYVINTASISFLKFDNDSVHLFLNDGSSLIFDGDEAKLIGIWVNKVATCYLPEIEKPAKREKKSGTPQNTSSD